VSLDPVVVALREFADRIGSMGILKLDGRGAIYTRLHTDENDRVDMCISITTCDVAERTSEFLEQEAAGIIQAARIAAVPMTSEGIIEKLQ
jgi:hypothetical protein